MLKDHFSAADHVEVHRKLKVQLKITLLMSRGECNHKSDFVALRLTDRKAFVDFVAKLKNLLRFLSY
jgi:hypothetical protein